MPRTRLDQALVARGLCPSREQAQRAILAGLVQVNDQRAEKASTPTKPQDHITLAQPPKYVGRGGFKLEHALETFALRTEGQTVIDLGASTGGFTDCVLQRGAARVYAVDVGAGQLAWKLRQDPRVVVMERRNARYLSAGDFPDGFTGAELVVVDCSFISLRKILPRAIALLRPSGNIIALAKPQFEAGKMEADKGSGVILDPTVHQRVLAELAAFVQQFPEIKWRGMVESPLRGAAGNKEFLIWLEKIG